MDILIKDLPDEVHAELVRRAAASQLSLRAYLRQLLARSVAVPALPDWLQQVSELGALDPDGGTGVDLVAEARAEDDRPQHR